MGSGVGDHDAVSGRWRPPNCAGARRGLPAFESLLRDLRYGLRTLIKSPGFAAGLMLLVGVAATLIPAYRATRVDPIVTLRSE